MTIPDNVLDDLTYYGCFSADTAAMDARLTNNTPAQVTRAAVRAAIAGLAANDLIRIPDMVEGESIMYVPDPPYDRWAGPELRPVINNFGDKEQDLCECDRPDERDNPHRHDKTMACIYWMAGRPSQADRIDACRQLNIKDIETPSEVSK